MAATLTAVSSKSTDFVKGLAGGNRHRVRPPTLDGVAYKPRIETRGGIYHLGTRGNNKRPIFLDDFDRRTFLRLLQHVATKYGWTIYAYCLMGNHYHLVIQIGDAGLSQGMCELNTGYAVDFNARHGRVNHLFGRRFWDEIISGERQLLETCRYVVLNPCRAGMRRTPAEWIWSSYRATIGAAVAFPRLAVRAFLAHISRDHRTAAEAFRVFCAERPGGELRRQPP